MNPSNSGNASPSSTGQNGNSIVHPVTATVVQSATIDPTPDNSVYQHQQVTDSAGRTRATSDFRAGSFQSSTRLANKRSLSNKSNKTDSAPINRISPANAHNSATNSSSSGGINNNAANGSNSNTNINLPTTQPYSSSSNQGHHIITSSSSSQPPHNPRVHLITASNSNTRDNTMNIDEGTTPIHVLSKRLEETSKAMSKLEEFTDIMVSKFANVLKQNTTFSFAADIDVDTQINNALLKLSTEERESKLISMMTRYNVVLKALKDRYREESERQIEHEVTISDLRKELAEREEKYLEKIAEFRRAVDDFDIEKRLFDIMKRKYCDGCRAHLECARENADLRNQIEHLKNKFELERKELKEIIGMKKRDFDSLKNELQQEKDFQLIKMEEILERRNGLVEREKKLAEREENFEIKKYNDEKYKSDKYNRIAELELSNNNLKNRDVNQFIELGKILQSKIHAVVRKLGYDGAWSRCPDNTYSNVYHFINQQLFIVPFNFLFLNSLSTLAIRIAQSINCFLVFIVSLL